MLAKVFNKSSKFFINKISNLCHHPWSIYFLGIFSFSESFIFYIPPEMLMLPMCYLDRKKAFFYAFITTITSVIGAACGFLIGFYLWDSAGEYIFTLFPNFKEYFDTIGTSFETNAFSTIFLAAFTPIPYKVVTIGAGIYSDKVSIFTLLWVSVLGRGLRYFALAAIAYILKEKAGKFIDRYFKWIIILFSTLLILIIYLKSLI